jgi:hypothetical protein
LTFSPKEEDEPYQVLPFHTGVYRSKLHPQNAVKARRYGSHPRGT